VELRDRPKDRFFDRKLQISASAYYINWSNIQQAFYVPSCGIQFTTNAGQAVSKGFDLQSQWQVTHNFEIELTLGYTDAKFSKTALDANGDVLDVAGDSLDVVPWTATLGAQYNFTMAGREGFIRGDYIFNSKRHTPIPNEDPRTAFYDSGLVPDPATNEVSAKAGLNLGAWDLSIFAENLLNAHPQLNLQHQDSETLLFNHPADLDAYWMPFTPNRRFKADPRTLARPKGMYYFTPDGRPILDAVAGLWCVNAGHGGRRSSRPSAVRPASSTTPPRSTSAIRWPSSWPVGSPS
jgi:hypothetical protein